MNGLHDIALRLGFAQGNFPRDGFTDSKIVDRASRRVSQSVKLL